MSDRPPIDEIWVAPLAPVLPSPARRAFLWLLPLALFPPLAAVVAWASVLVIGRQASNDPTHGSWSRRLLGLAIVDTLVLVASLGGNLAGLEGGGRPVVSSPKIGVMLDAKPGVRGPKIIEVLPDSPAAKAGLKPSDELVAVDGQAVPDVRRLGEALRRRPAGTERRVRYWRDGQYAEATIVPSTSVHAQRKRGRSPGLFERLGPCPRWRWSPTWRVEGLAIFLLMLALVGGRIGVPGAWLLAMVALLEPLAYGVAPLLVRAGLCRAVGGISLAAMLAMMTASAVVLLATLGPLYLAARRGGFGRLPGLDLAFWPSLGGGLLLLFGGMLRLTPILTLVDALLAPAVPDSAYISGIMGLARSPLATALLIIDVVVLTAVVEEIVYRGIIYPWLARLWSPRWAILLSAALFAIAHPYSVAGTVHIGFIGLVLAWARQRSGGLAVPILLHAAVNGTVTLLQLI